MARIKSRLNKIEEIAKARLEELEASKYQVIYLITDIKGNEEQLEELEAKRLDAKDITALNLESFKEDLRATKDSKVNYIVTIKENPTEELIKANEELRNRMYLMYKHKDQLGIREENIND